MLEVYLKTVVLLVAHFFGGFGERFGLSPFLALPALFYLWSRFAFFADLSAPLALLVVGSLALTASVLVPDVPGFAESSVANLGLPFRLCIQT